MIGNFPPLVPCPACIERGRTPATLVEQGSYCRDHGGLRAAERADAERRKQEANAR